MSAGFTQDLVDAFQRDDDLLNDDVSEKTRFKSDIGDIDSLKKSRL